MAGRSDDAVIRLVFQTLGADAAQKMADALKGAAAAGAQAQEAVEGAGRAAADSANAAGRSADQMGKAASQAGRHAADGLDDVRDAAARARARLDDVGEAAERAKSKASRFGIEFGRFAQDAAVGWELGGLSGAIRATANNIEGVLVGLGVGGGLIGVLSVIAGMAPMVLSKLKGIFDEDLPKGFVEEVQRLRDRLKELEEKPVKLAADYAEIDAAREQIEALQAAKDALDRMMNTASDDEKASGDAVAKELARPESRVYERLLRERLLRDRIQHDPRLPGLEEEVRRQQAAVEQHRRLIDGMGGIPKERLAREEVHKKLEESVRKAQAARDAVVKESEERVRTRLDDAVHKATKGVGEEQEQAQDQLAAMFRQLGTKESDLIARQIEHSNPRLVRFRRELEEKRKAENKVLYDIGQARERGALEELREAQAEQAEEEREFLKTHGEDVYASGRAAGESIRRRQREQAREADREQKRAAQQTERSVDQSAEFFATPTLTAEMGAALARNEALQARGGRGARSDDAMRAAMEAEVARRIAGQPGVDGREAAIAGKLVNGVIEGYHRQLFDLVQQVQSQQWATISLYQQLDAELAQLRRGSQSIDQRLRDGDRWRRSGLPRGR